MYALFNNLIFFSVCSFLSIYLSIHLSIYLSIYLSFLFSCLLASFLPSFILFIQSFIHSFIHFSLSLVFLLEGYYLSQQQFSDGACSAAVHTVRTVHARGTLILSFDCIIILPPLRHGCLLSWWALFHLSSGTMCCHCQCQC